MSGRAKGYVEAWRPQKRTQILLGQIEEVLVEYREELPITIRQLFYRLVAQYGFDKTEKAYNRLSNHVVTARRARLIDFDHIRDDSIQGGAPWHWQGEEHFLTHLRDRVRAAKLDAMEAQPVNVVVYCEAAGMLPQLQRAVERYSVPVFSSGGFDSVTAKKQLADQIAVDGRPAIIGHVGDFDPSGVSMFSALEEDVKAFLRVDMPAQSVDFHRIALNEEQVRGFDLPTAPPKRSDSRSARWDGETCQLEALRPSDLTALVRAWVESVLDLDLVARTRAADERFRRDLFRRLAG